MNEKVAHRIFNGILCPLPGVYVLDPAHTFAEFTVQHLVVGHIKGRFYTIKGGITVLEDPTKSSLKVDIETVSISTGHTKRDEHLRGEQFFDVKNHPTMSYQSSKFIPQLDGQWTAEGVLTIRDISLPVLLTGRISGITIDPSSKVRVGVQAQTKISRTNFGLLAEIEKENGGITLGDDILISINTEALLQK